MAASFHSVVLFRPVTSCWTPNIRRSVVFHRSCVQKLEEVVLGCLFLVECGFYTPPGSIPPSR